MFYDNKLHSSINETKGSSQLKFWPNGREKPLAFVHVAGREASQTVATAEGSMASKSNAEEAAMAVREAMYYNISKTNEINIYWISQYR